MKDTIFQTIGERKKKDKYMNSKKKKKRVGQFENINDDKLI